MTAVDTNVLVRLLTQDDARQASAVRILFASSTVWIAKTVLLETNWVLRSLYGFKDDAIRGAFTRLLGLAHVQAEDAPAVAAALALSERGIEFADALHLTSRPEGTAFVSFDTVFVRRAARAGAPAVTALR